MRETWSELELLPNNALRTLETTRLRRQIAYLHKNSDFYRPVLDKVGRHRDIKHVEDLERIPFTEKDDLRKSLAAQRPLGLHVAAAPDQIIQIQATSGTSGEPSYYGLTARDCDVWSEMGARAFFATGIRPADTVLHGWSLSKGFSGGIPVVKMLQFLGCRVLPIGAEAGTDRILTVIKNQQVRAFCTTPSLALHIGAGSPQVLGIDASELGVRTLAVGGEPGGGLPSIRQRIEASWNATSSELLGNSDAAPIVFAECPQRDGMHFIGQGSVLVELIDPESGAVLKPESGVTVEIVYTTLEREASPVLRFRSRDHVVILDTECACGRTSPKIRCIGRTDDMLIVRGVNVWPTAVQEIVMNYHGELTGNLRIVADFDGPSTNKPLKIKVEHIASLAPNDVNRVKLELLHRIKSLLNFRPELFLVAPGVIEAPGTAKLQLIERPKGRTPN